MIETERIGPLLFALPPAPEPRTVDVRRIARLVFIITLVGIPFGLAVRAGLALLAAQGNVLGVQNASRGLVVVLFLIPYLLLLRHKSERPAGVPPEAIRVGLTKPSSVEFESSPGWLWREGGMVRFDRSEGNAARLTADAVREVRSNTIGLAVPEGWPPLRLEFASTAKDARRLQGLRTEPLAPGPGSVLPALWRERPIRVVGAWRIGGTLALGIAAGRLIFGNRPPDASFTPSLILIGLMFGQGLAWEIRRGSPERAAAVAKLRARG